MSKYMTPVCALDIHIRVAYLGRYRSDIIFAAFCIYDQFVDSDS
jgi:hypothetical protein